MIISIEELRGFCIESLVRCGMGEVDARTAADVLVTTDMWGINTHGTKQLYNYTTKIRAGGIDPRAVPAVISDGPAFAVIDGRGAMAHLSACKAMELAIEKARVTGIGYVGVKGSTHFGAAGYYANMAARQDMVGIAMSSVERNMTVPGARGNVIGNNPFSYAAPAGEEHPVFLDIALSVTAAGRVYHAAAHDGKVPDGWMVDDEGVPTNDATGFPAHGALLPMAGHKGYGIAVMVEILSGAMTGALMTSMIPQWMGQVGTITDEGHAFIVINVGAWMPIDQFKSRMDMMIRSLKDAPKAKGSDRIYVPGEMEWEKYHLAQERGIPLDPEHVSGLNKLAEGLGMERRLGGNEK